MAQEIARRLPDALFDAVIKRHCRRGLRRGCTCEYCDAKSRLTNEIKWGIQRMSHGYLIPGYRVKGGMIVRPQCHCTDGCPKGCQALQNMDAIDTLNEQSQAVYGQSYYEADVFWRQLPPSDSLEEAIRNRNERLRERLRVKGRRVLLALREAHLPEEKRTQYPKMDFDRFYYGNKLKRSNTNEHRNQQSQPRDAGSPGHNGTGGRARGVDDERFREAARAADALATSSEPGGWQRTDLLD